MTGLSLAGAEAGLAAGALGVSALAITLGVSLTTSFGVSLTTGLAISLTTTACAAGCVVSFAAILGVGVEITSVLGILSSEPFIAIT